MKFGSMLDVYIPQCIIDLLLFASMKIKYNYSEFIYKYVEWNCDFANDTLDDTDYYHSLWWYSFNIHHMQIWPKILSFALLLLDLVCQSW